MSSSMSRASSDPPVDLEKGGVSEEVEAAVAEAEERKNPLVVLCVMLLVDVVVALEVLVFIGLFAWAVTVSNNWWDPWPAVVILLPFVVFTLCVKPKTNYALCMKKLASGSNNIDDLSNKLLLSEK